MVNHIKTDLCLIKFCCEQTNFIDVKLYYKLSLKKLL